MNTKHTNELAHMNIAGWLAELHATEAAAPKPYASVARGKARWSIYAAVPVVVKVVRQHSRRTEVHFVMQ